MRLRFWNSSQSSTLVMMEGCLDRPKTSAPRRKTLVATYWFAPLMRLTTAMTAATPMTTPMSVRTLRSLWAQRLEAEIATASERFIVEGLAMVKGGTDSALIVTYAGSGEELRGVAMNLLLASSAQLIEDRQSEKEKGGEGCSPPLKRLRNPQG